MEPDYDKLVGFVFFMWLLFVVAWCLNAAAQGVALWLS